MKTIVYDSMTANADCEYCKGNGIEPERETEWIVGLCHCVRLVPKKDTVVITINPSEEQL